VVFDGVKFGDVPVKDDGKTDLSRVKDVTSCQNLTFQGSTFKGDICSFKHTSFYSKIETDFECARFHCRDVAFDRAIFKGNRTSFAQAQLSSHSGQDLQSSFRNVKFEADTTVVDGCDFGTTDFHGADLTKVNWTDNTNLVRCPSSRLFAQECYMY
jgi:uncharacterized protein YjbI with pentapeptide repeats